MKLKEACRIAEACGLSTVGEAVLNVEMNATGFWPYEKMAWELVELVKEADQYEDDTPISHILEGK